MEEMGKGLEFILAIVRLVVNFLKVVNFSCLFHADGPGMKAEETLVLETNKAVAQFYNLEMN